MGVDIFGVPRALVGMVHVGALPGTPRSELSVPDLARRACEEAELLVGEGFDALILENMHDVPYLRRDVGPEIIAAMTTVVGEVRSRVDAPVGVQVLAGANRPALAVAHATGAEFIRAEGFVYSAVADEGLLDEADAGALLRYRRHIGAESIKIICDIKKKHSAHSITADVSLPEFARAADFFGADGIVVTGAATGRPTSIADLREVRAATSLPIAVGSGATPDTLRDLYEYASAVIIGSWYKQGGEWSNAPDPQRVRELVKAARRARL